MYLSLLVFLLCLLLAFQDQQGSTNSPEISDEQNKEAFQQLELLKQNLMNNIDILDAEKDNVDGGNKTAIDNFKKTFELYVSAVGNTFSSSNSTLNTSNVATNSGLYFVRLSSQQIFEFFLFV